MRRVASVAWVAWLCSLSSPHAHADAPKLGDLDSAEDWDALMLISAPEATSSQPQATIESESEAEPNEKDKDKAERRKSRKKPRAQKATGDKYRSLQSSWHRAPVEEDGSWGTPVEGGPPPLVLRSVADGVEPAVLTPASDEGGFDAADVAFATQLLGGWDGGPSADERLLDLIYMAARHFDVPYVRVVSGIRHDRKGSRHSHGLAADIVLPGVKDDDLAALFRAQGFVGVGTYPKAGFVHIDVRERSYFWVDNSAPGRKGRQRQVRAEEAKAADEMAMARGEGPNVNPEGLQRALNKRASTRWKREKPQREKKREERHAERTKKREHEAAASADSASAAPQTAQASNAATAKPEASEPAGSAKPATAKGELAAKPTANTKHDPAGSERPKHAAKREKPASAGKVGAKPGDKPEEPPTAQGG